MANAYSHSGDGPATVVELLRWRAVISPEDLSYRFTRIGGSPDEALTYRQLDARARRVAARLQKMRAAGEPVLIALGPGLDYIVAFFGCLYAGAIAVPAYSLRPNRSDTRLRAIVGDAQPKVVLTASGCVSGIERQFDDLCPGLACLAMTDGELAESEDWEEPHLSRESIAYLQYTSGSTADPKGVMVTHGNLLHNTSLLNRCFGHSSRTHIVSWLPLHHDMGLVGAILQPLQGGFSATLMSPNAFLQRPFRWLEAITRYRATSSGAPTFAYELCVRSITEEQRATLDLSDWTVAGCGAEPIRADVLERFVEFFRPAGFRPGALFPCYGLAEATLIVTGAKKGALPVLKSFEASGLERHVGRECSEGTITSDCRRLVGCGSALPDVEVKIVNPETHVPVGPGIVGEIWVSGPSVAAGYWNRPKDTWKAFNAFCAGGIGPFLRTGDLGFLRDGELFVTGRRKELIIIHGRNFYPQDVEKTVQSCHPTLLQGTGAAFSIDDGLEERLVIVQELGRAYRFEDPEPAIMAIRQAVWEEHDLEPYAIALVKTFGVPRTSSGKIQRHVCRQRYKSQVLPIVAEWRKEHSELPAQHRDVTKFPLRSSRSPNGAPTTDTIRAWLVSRLAELVGVKASEIDSRAPFGQYGLDSVRVVGISGELEERLGVRVSPTLLWEHQSIDAVSQYLALELSAHHLRVRTMCSPQASDRCRL